MIVAQMLLNQQILQRKTITDKKHSKPYIAQAFDYVSNLLCMVPIKSGNNKWLITYTLITLNGIHAIYLKRQIQVFKSPHYKWR